MRRLETGERLVVASHNEGKVREINELIQPFGVEAVSAGELGLPEPDETGQTFADNAILKAVAAAKASGLMALSDDSGLAVDALDGAPGIYSA
ncbi:MAG: non-canonical purine NTP pyrophosphatase, partial [Hyphomicrobiales bacterium]|nr:non-canonical purine NTP pyrophosphatase [Hyphomicrobiales bacterium]